MFHNGTGSNGLAIIVDSRTKIDRETGGCLDTSRLRHFLGDTEWNHTLRIALREHGSEPLRSKDLPGIKEQVDSLLSVRAISTLLILQTAVTPSVRNVNSAWNMYGGPGSPYKWAGTVFKGLSDLYICPVLNPQNYEDVYEYLIRRWFQQAHAVARGRIAPLRWPVLHTLPNQEMVAALKRIQAATGRRVSVDIETNIKGTIITAIGLSNGEDTISTPWDSYPISGRGTIEPSLGDYDSGIHVRTLVLDILKGRHEKVLHNGAFDVYELSKRGITVSNFTWDTLLMHRVAFPQFRHGLQQACASVFCVEPWKCVWKPPNALRGTGEDIWLSDPDNMRLYNCQDAYATWVLCNRLQHKVGL